MTDTDQLRDQLLPAVRDAVQETADQGLDTLMHAVNLWRHVSPIVTPYLTGRDLVDHVRRIDASRTLSAEDLAAAIAERIAETGVFDKPIIVVIDEVAETVNGDGTPGKIKAMHDLLTRAWRAGYEPTVLDVKASDVSAWLQPQHVPGPAMVLPTQQARPEYLTAGTVGTGKTRISSIALTMAGIRADELSEGETEAMERGISPVTYRRLYPAVTGELADQLAPRIVYLAAHLAARTEDERIADVLMRDPRSVGFRLAVYEARVAATKETTRRLGTLVEWALTSIQLGREATALAKLAKADAILA